MRPVLMLDEREKLFFEASFVVFNHDFIAIIYLLENKIFCVDCSDSFYHTYRVFFEVEYAYVF